MNGHLSRKQELEEISMNNFENKVRAGNRMIKTIQMFLTTVDKMTVVLPYPEERAEVLCMAIRGKHFSRILKHSEQLFQ